ncbi:LysR family transcriptional regulator [Inhella gelatinilytica]|uniref:LysR family transcriptional regulator n=1 Tax=Inhella gelatinilytica TaxID=2795030 RepID=A0A931IWJ1_9BURK|nr:LysR family transcriptional regulator [Inhella gelatinilytica]MBH9552866.1 LysR family transcriptional regulator [Inhella gelatinilytica]
MESIDVASARLFLTLAEELHFGRTAERLGWRQPQVSKVLQSLEHQVGVRLVARSSRRVTLTEAGDALLEPLRSWLTQGEGLADIAKAAALGLRGQLRVGLVSPAGFGLLPQWLRHFKSATPEVELILREATLDIQAEALRSGTMDLGCVLMPQGASPAGLSGRLVAVEPMMLALSQPAMIRLGPTPSLEALLQEPLVLFPREIAPELHDAVVDFYHRQGHEPRLVQRAVQMATLIHLVSADFGVAWVPASMRALQREGVVYVPAPAQAPSCETWMVWQAPARAVVQRFMASLPVEGAGAVVAA